MNLSLPIRILLLFPTSGVDFGIQQGHGKHYKTILIQRSGLGDLQFDFSILYKAAPDGKADFSGDCVQGNRGNRFIYIDIGTYAGQIDTPWSRRLKIPLSHITSDMIQSLANNPSWILCTSIAGTGRDGGPNCGTVKPFSGWHILAGSGQKLSL